MWGQLIGEYIRYFNQTKHYDTQYKHFLMLPYYAEKMCWARGQKTNPYLCQISMKFAVWIPQYPNYKCWKYASDLLSGLWDMASQKSGAFIYAGTFIWQNTVFPYITLSHDLHHNMGDF